MGGRIMLHNVRVWLVFILAIGLVYAEINPNISIQFSAGKPSAATAKEDLLLSFVDANNQNQQVSAGADTLKFVGSLAQLPAAINETMAGARNDMLLNFGVADQSSQTLFNDNGAQVAVLTPPLNTPLSLAYANGNKPFYADGDNVLVIFSDQTTLKSFYQTTGQESDWLALEMSVPPVNSPNALETYQSKFQGQIVAETKDWVLMKFPNGSYLKVARSTTPAFLTILSTAR